MTPAVTPRIENKIKFGFANKTNALDKLKSGQSEKTTVNGEFQTASNTSRTRIKSLTKNVSRVANHTEKAESAMAGNKRQEID